ncbi:MAG: hypothetical protein GDA53_01540 [Rhodobacteraceae bacterium]|nr:hypothetical protein [Paracoccaceae bacterium]
MIEVTIFRDTVASGGRVPDLRTRLTAVGLHPFKQYEGQQAGIAGKAQPGAAWLFRMDD